MADVKTETDTAGPADHSSLTRLDRVGVHVTKANVSFDGRVDLSIRQTSHELAHILSKAIHRPHEPDLGAKPKETNRPPKLSIVIQVVGSRGDIQPFVALAIVLKRHGHRVRLATHSAFKTFVQDHGLEFFSIGGDPAQLMAFMVKNPGLLPGLDSLRLGDVGKRRKDIFDMACGCWQSCVEPGDQERPFVPDVIIANPPSFAHIHCAEKLACPLHIMFTMPYSPTTAFPHPLANINSTDDADASVTNFMSYILVDMLTCQGLGDVINRFRQQIGLEPVSQLWAPGTLSRLHVPHTYCWSPALIPKPKDWGPHINVAGFFFMDTDTSYEPSPELEAFLDGPPPIYIGFGSIVVDDPKAMSKMIFDTVRKTSQRALISKGWSGLGADQLDLPSDVFLVEDVPHDWLFKHVSCVVHHGGAGTTSAGIKLGKPTVVVPFFGDQAFWGAMIAKAGAGPEPIPYSSLDADVLANQIEFALKPSTVEAAQKLAQSISHEDGTGTGAEYLYKQLCGLECNLMPGKVAVWRIRRTSVRLSALAATVLINEGLLSFHDLKLFRPVEYETETGPYDPITGGAGAIMSTISTIVFGLFDMPVETLKALKIHPQDGNDPISSAMETAVDTTKNAAKIVEAGVKSPMDFTHAVARGFHNAPKLYGDTTVRKSDTIIDLKSGVIAATKEFGFGMYDGITGLVTQPYQGAKSGGALGLVKGIGKGIGGAVLKPSAAVFGVAGYTLKGLEKELQAAVGSEKSQIFGSRTFQGYVDYKESTEAERVDIVKRWKVLKSHMVKKRSPDEIIVDWHKAQKDQIKELVLRRRRHANVDSQIEAELSDRIKDDPDDRELRDAIKSSISSEDSDLERAMRASVLALENMPDFGKDANRQDLQVQEALMSGMENVKRIASHPVRSRTTDIELVRAVSASLVELRRRLDD